MDGWGVPLKNLTASLTSSTKTSLLYVCLFLSNEIDCIVGKFT